MSTQHSNPLAPNGQPSQANDNRIIQAWLDSTNEALDALLNWRAYLRAWQTHPHVTDAAFMAAVQNMTEAGLLEWLDANRADIDALRKEVTGGDV